MTFPHYEKLKKIQDVVNCYLDYVKLNHQIANDLNSAKNEDIISKTMAV